MSKRKGLLCIGMGLSAFALAATAANVIIAPYARACHGYAFSGMLISLAAALALFLAAGKKIGAAEEAQLARIARVTRPAFLIALLVCHLLMGYWMEYVPSGDNFMLYDGSYTLAKLGNFGGQDFDLYLSRYSNQWGFFLILTAFHKLLLALGITNRFYALVLVQTALYTLAMNALLAIARRLRGVRGELMLTLMLALCAPLYLAAAVLYTDTFSLPFVIFTLYFALRVGDAATLRGALAHAALCGLCALIGCQIKMTVAIVLIAAVIVWLLTMRPVRALAAAALSAVILVGGTQGVHRAMTTYVLDPAMVAQHNTPTIHWVMMSIPTSDNPYGGATGDYGITWGMMEAGASREAIMDSIYSRIKDRIYTLRYPNRLMAALMRKNAAALGDGTFGMTEMLDDNPVRENAVSSLVLEGRPLYGAYSAVCSGVWFAALLLAAASVCADVRRRDTRGAIVAIAVLGALIFLLLWEARSRYVFGYVPLVLLLAAGGAGINGEGKLWQNIRSAR